MKIVIIGGGASGMFLASKLNNKNHDIYLIERNNKLGKKLVLTGNGHCNFTNSDFENFANIYNNDFFYSSYKNFDNKRLIEYFEKIGINSNYNIYNNKKYFYPKSNDSKSVFYNLYDKIVDNNVNIIYDTFVNNILHENNKFIIRTSKKNYDADILIVATGGMSYQKTGSDGNMYSVIKKLGHNIINPLPALTCLYYENKNLDLLKGQRINCKIDLYIDNIIFDSEIGEMQFSNGYISGIPIMNLSRMAIKHIFYNKDCIIKINFFDSSDEKMILEYLIQRKNNLSYKLFKDFLCGYLNNNLINYIFLNYDLKKYSNTKMSLINNELLKRLVDILLNFEIKIIKKFDFEKSQITQGGIDTNEINPISFESKILKNLYLIGEIVDVDGKCGGYNLQFAFSSANSCYESIKNK